MGRMVKRLSKLEIDEVSLVDRPANQYGTVEITKAYQEDNMTVFDASGAEVFEDELEPGDFVYDNQGTEFVVTEQDDDDDDDGYVDADDDARELQGVGKGMVANGPLREGGSRLGLTVASRAARAGEYGRAGADLGRAYGQNAAVKGRIGMRRGREKVGAHIGRNKLAYGGGAGAAAVGGAGYGYSRTKKSLGDSVLEDLSKALTDGDRDEVIAKAMDRMESIAKRNDELEEAVAGLYEDREAEGYFEVAKGYQFGDADEIGGILHRASQYLPQEDVAALDRLFSASGEIAKSYMDEVGYGSGYDASDTMGQVMELAGQAVAKNAEMGLTQEQAATALFSANPGAYDAYEAEQRQR